MQDPTDSPASGETKIELEILNPEKFQTLQKIRDFVTGDGAKALRYALVDEVWRLRAIVLEGRYQQATEPEAGERRALGL